MWHMGQTAGNRWCWGGDWKREGGICCSHGVKAHCYLFPTVGRDFGITRHDTFGQGEAASGHVFEGDALLIMPALQHDCQDDSSPYGNILNDTRLIIHSMPKWKIVFSRRETNKVAHRLAWMSLSCDILLYGLRNLLM